MRTQDNTARKRTTGGRGAIALIAGVTVIAAFAVGQIATAALFFTWRAII